MASRTPNFKLLKLQKGDKLSASSYQFTSADRDIIDRMLLRGTTGHKHDGASIVPVNPDTALSLTAVADSGSIPAGRTLYYRYTYVDSDGNESLPSPESTVTTQSPVAVPSAPTKDATGTGTTGGTLPAGQYQYALSAYRTSSALETQIGDNFAIKFYSGNTNRVLLTLPTLPTNADGFNVYRRSPNEGDFFFLSSIDMDVTTPPTTYADTGSTTPNTARTPRNVNLSGGNASVEISLPGATPSVPDGYTWKIYRTTTPGRYENSMLHHVVERVTEPNGPLLTTHTDLGGNTSSGMFPIFGTDVTNPEPIVLTDMAEASGYLPTGRVTVPHQVDFNNQGTGIIEVGYLEKIWVCEFEYAEIVHVRAVVNPDSPMAGADLIADVLRYVEGATPEWESIYTGATPNDKPTILDNEWLGVVAPPNVTSLVRGDALRVEIEQVGSGATPTEQDLTVSVYMIVRESRGDDTTTETGILGIL